MEMTPPLKPPRGVKPAKETSGLLMSVIRTLSSSETNEQRDREKAKLESEYKQCDRRLDELVSKHEGDLTKVMHLFSTISQLVTANRSRIARVKENLQDCKKKLHCRRDELRNLWAEGLEYKHMLQLLDEIEKMNDVPKQLSNHMARKHYLHATKLLVEAVTLGRDTLESVESIKELSHELEQKKEQLHLQLLSELKTHLYVKPAQRILSLRRQGSGREVLQRNLEQRLSGQKSATGRNAAIHDNIHVVEEDLNSVNPEENSPHFIGILVRCLSLLDKLSFAVGEIQQEMPHSLANIVERTTQHLRDFTMATQTTIETKHILRELFQTLFDQLTDVAAIHAIFLLHIENESKLRNNLQHNLQTYTVSFVWNQAQTALEAVLTDYLEVPNITGDLQASASQLQTNTNGNIGDLSSYFSRRKQQVKRKTLFQFEGSTSALNLSTSMQSTINVNKTLICASHPNNILLVFQQLITFIEQLENSIGIENGSSQLYYFVTQYVTSNYLRRKSDEVLDQIEMAVRAADAWKSTVLLDLNADYKPLLVSTVTVERCVREWRAVLQALPIYSEQIASYSCKALREYKDTCFAAYQGIVQPHSEDRRISSAAWLKDDDISRFLKSLPNWLNLKSQQEYYTRCERNVAGRRQFLKQRDQPSEEESPEDVRMRNRREAEILASNLGEGGIGIGEILSDMALLKELAQLQESMEWFSTRMFQFSGEFRQEPSSTTAMVLVLSTSRTTNSSATTNNLVAISASTLQQLTSIAQEFDELANTCLLLLHLEVRVQCFHYLLAQSNFNRDTHEPDPKVLELSRVLANVDEAMTSSLHPRKCKYIFEGLGHLIAKILIASAQYMQTIDENGIQRICRNIFALQQTLTNITMTREIALDHARHYFELFFLEPKEVLNVIVEKGPEFSELEYMNALQLLHRSQSGVTGTVEADLERLSDILGEVGVTV